jgi:hypothetical protein
MFGLFLAWNCHTHYGYRSKVRVDKQKELAVQKKKVVSKSPSDTVLEELNYNLSASNDTCLSPQFYFKEESVLKCDSALIEKRTFQKNENKKSISPKSKQKNKKNTPLNYHAKWSLILGIFSLFVFPIILPAAIAPLAMFFGLKALKEIKGNYARGKGRAIIGILLGTLTSLFMLMLLVLTIIYGPAIETYLFFLMSLLFFIYFLNRLVHYIIERSSKNLDFKVNPKTEIKIGMRIFLLILLSFLTAINFVLVIAYSSVNHGP